MATTNVKTYSGNRIVLEFNGIAVGLIQSLRAADDYAPDPASGVGDIHVQEHVPTRARHQLSVSNMTLFKGNMRDAGIAVENGDGALQGVIIDTVIYSKDTGAVLRKYTGCTYASGDVDISAHRIVMQSGVLLALDASGTGL